MRTKCDKHPLPLLESLAQMLGKTDPSFKSSGPTTLHKYSPTHWCSEVEAGHMDVVIPLHLLSAPQQPPMICLWDYSHAMCGRHPVGFLSKSNVDCPLRDQACLGLLASHHPHHHSHPPRLSWLCHPQISGSLSLSDPGLTGFFETCVAHTLLNMVMIITHYNKCFSQIQPKLRDPVPQSQQCPTIPSQVLGFIQSRDIARQNCHKNGENDAWHETHMAAMEHDIRWVLGFPCLVSSGLQCLWILQSWQQCSEPNCYYLRCIFTQPCMTLSFQVWTGCFVEPTKISCWLSCPTLTVFEWCVYKLGHPHRLEEFQYLQRCTQSSHSSAHLWQYPSMHQIQQLSAEHLLHHG